MQCSWAKYDCPGAKHLLLKKVIGTYMFCPEASQDAPGQYKFCPEASLDVLRQYMKCPRTLNLCLGTKSFLFQDIKSLPGMILFLSQSKFYNVLGQLSVWGL